MLGEVKARIEGFVWCDDDDARPAWARLLAFIARLIVGLAEEVASGRLTLWAMSLVYTTLLSLVPLLAFSFSVLKGFGVHNQLLPALQTLLEPLGVRGAEIGRHIVGFVERMDVGVLGAMGLGLLIYTVISLIEKIEKAFNEVWHVRQSRSFVQRFTGYLSVILVGPLLVFSALGVTASLMSQEFTRSLLAIEPLGTLVNAMIKALPFLLVATAFILIYLLIPNTRVKAKAAIIGGLCAGVLWETTGWLFGIFIVSSGSYTAIYSTFAILILFMLWLYLSWLILLLGAKVAFFIQNPTALDRHIDLPLTTWRRLELGLHLMALIARSHLRGGPLWDMTGLTGASSGQTEWVDEVLHDLCDSGLLRRTADEPSCYLPGRDLEAIPLAEVVMVLTGGERVNLASDDVLVNDTVDLLQLSLQRDLAGRNVREWVGAGGQGDQAAESPGP
ncbi:MAG: YihY family inner membrane protein [Gammaproteobacteria bacterium]|nr:YihY family inner membrane protein [Gammaproteobacteria bacterium]